jgi:hypothetical protein
MDVGSAVGVEGEAGAVKDAGSAVVEVVQAAAVAEHAMAGAAVGDANVAVVVHTYGSDNVRFYARTQMGQ